MTDGEYQQMKAVVTEADEILTEIGKLEHALDQARHLAGRVSAADGPSSFYERIIRAGCEALIREARERFAALRVTPEVLPPLAETPSETQHLAWRSVHDGVAATSSVARGRHGCLKCYRVVRSQRSECDHWVTRLFDNTIVTGSLIEVLRACEEYEARLVACEVTHE